MPATDRRPGQAQPDYLKKIAYNVFELGHGYKTCAAVLDLSIYTVREWYAQYKLGLYKPSTIESKSKKTFYSQAFRQKVLSDYFENKPSITELSRRYEVSKRTLKRWIDEQNKTEQ